MTITTTIADDIEVEVEYVYEAGCAGRDYLPNGDPGYPDDDELEILSVLDAAGQPVETDADEERRIEELCLEDARGW